ncbi:hypothetical protein BDN70DRAFT_346860 [Pholiota conissans]|uniref:Uncharacterized protein n=1 Tax=Pholiota conissans TaxID=109636 RepID=A0A9P6CNX5_9AGAR|nr:hypothetical protein BDN70DRAFT_346860 [Pholiota conissans]
MASRSSSTSMLMSSFFVFDSDLDARFRVLDCTPQLLPRPSQESVTSSHQLPLYTSSLSRHARSHALPSISTFFLYTYRQSDEHRHMPTPIDFKLGVGFCSPQSSARRDAFGDPYPVSSPSSTM